ncbi:hypothetical protein [Acidovorax sp. SUPP2539]|uniref:hypothetical protein n=1 Tax=Acidovorax sp. SUPP2539 TaxID=2920878 RepID=UPI0023DE317E|nr:hypothetical protein [Acidovorax sp. SUPP2539]GKS91532.1 hypothetical protein AVTE2539_19225 [Acidovorax sp. SUPP2539]
MNNKTILKQAESLSASDCYEKIKSQVKKLISKEEAVLLDKTFLIFNDDENSQFVATASFDQSFYEFNEDYQHQIKFNVATNTDYSYTFIHEFSHIICSHYNIECTHNLEFAIINYCLRNKVFNNSIQCYFRAYDVHQDKSYPILSINPCQFDAFIKCIKWDTLQELVNESKRLAKIIRQKSIN